ncbi:MAG: cation:proton antiporter, partial [Acidobacteriota bacterium]
RLRVGGALAFAALMFAFGLAWLAEWAGSAVIIGSFAAGLVLAKTEKAAEIESKVFDISQFFIPIFFVSVGAAIDLRALNPFDPATRGYFGIGLLLTVAAILGKVVSGWSVFGQPLRKVVIGVGMIPRGEVGLIFAQIGRQRGLLNDGLYGSVALMVIITTFIAPILLRLLLPQGSSGVRGVVGSLVNDPPYEDEPPGEGP